jgi:hypothetical protein
MPGLEEGLNKNAHAVMLCHRARKTDCEPPFGGIRDA